MLLAAAVVTAACGGVESSARDGGSAGAWLEGVGGESTPTTGLSTDVTTIPPSTPTPTIAVGPLTPEPTTPTPPTTPPVTLADAERAWSGVVATAAFSSTAPWVQQGRFFAVAHVDDSRAGGAAAPAAVGINGFAVHEFDGTVWTPSAALPDDNCASMPGSCTISLVGATTARPVVVISWCCPMGHPFSGGPMATAWQIGEAGVTAAGPEQYFFGGASGDDGWSVDTCGRTWFAGTPDEDCVVHRTTTYTVLADGSTSRDVRDTENGSSITVCIESVGESCGFESVIRFDARCRVDPSYATAFSLEPCEYGWWVAYAEQRLSSRGFAVTVDGYYDHDERDAVVGFQRAAGLDADAFIGPATWRALFPDQRTCPVGDGTVWVCGDTNEDGIFGPGDIVPH